MLNLSTCNCGIVEAKCFVVNMLKMINSSTSRMNAGQVDQSETVKPYSRIILRNVSRNTSGTLFVNYNSNAKIPLLEPVNAHLSHKCFNYLCIYDDAVSVCQSIAVLNGFHHVAIAWMVVAQFPSL